jgi:hypothetical protein
MVEKIPMVIYLILLCEENGRGIIGSIVLSGKNLNFPTQRMGWESKLSN